MNTAVHESRDFSDALRAHGSLVRSIAHRIRARTPGNVEIDDLMQAGLIGLNEAMQRFDDRRECSFGTYASRRIEGAMLDTLRATDLASRRTRSQIRKIKQAVHKLEHELGRTPRAKEVADELGWTLHAFHTVMSAAGAGQLRSWDDVLETAGEEAEDDDVREIGLHAEPAADPLHSVQWRQRCRAVVQAVSALDQRHRQVMEMIYDEGRSMEDVGRELGITESRVSQLHATAVQLLRLRLRAW